MNNYDVVERVQEQYGESQYGSVKYTANELFLAYHTLDPSQAIERILEAKNILHDDEGELQRQYTIFKKIRNGKRIQRLPFT